MNTGEINSIKENHFQRYLNYAVPILENYNGTEPFHLYLKKYFSVNKKHGSKDRKNISSLCYHYFRVSNGVSADIGIKEKIIIADFLLNKKSSGLLKEFQPGWEQWIPLPIAKKIEKISPYFSLEKIFPFHEELSKHIPVYPFNFSFLIQPKLFVRIRPGKVLTVLNKLKSSQILFERVNENCLAFPQKERITEVLNIDKDAVIQDYNSQRVAEFFSLLKNSKKSVLKVWDCCAASGGKSILAFDILQNIYLTVTDIRKSILENLKKRFQRAGIFNYHAFVADIADASSLKSFKEKFNFIIADVPCSGSGTWARTPEQLLFFPKKKINEYAQLQKQIVANAQEKLEENGYLLYITCSVFKNENEENINFIQQNLPLELIRSEYLQGFEMQADTLFAALFKKRFI